MKKTKISQVSTRKSLRIPVVTVLMLIVTTFTGLSVSAHCDSYDGPVITDAIKAIETNDVNLVLKWVNEEMEEDIITLFRKTYNLQHGDAEVYKIVRTHFFETLVRLHRETEGASYTGLKPAGSTSPIIGMSDHAIASKNVDGMVEKLNNHIANVIREKYKVVSSLYPVKDESVEKGREYVEAYVDFTHTVEAFHDILMHGNSGH
ncbi:MAG: DUF6448 family protein [Bacteroidales bacterium]